MTSLFFLLSLAIAWAAYNLFRPIHQGVYGPIVSFAFGWLVGELALHHILWQVGLVSLFVLFGAVDGLFGALGFVLCVASWLAMAYYYLKSDNAFDEVNEALEVGLGRDYINDILPLYRDQLPLGPDYAKVRKPFTRPNTDTEIIKNIPFGQHGQALDLYRGRRSLDKAPVLLQIHGGAWTQNYGSKNEQAIPLMTHMAARNWISVATSYRLSPTATFPEHIIDCKEALIWIKDHIAEYGGDPDFVVVTGGSAGGHLSALMALSANDPAFQPGFENRDTQVQGAVPFYGLMDFSNSSDHYQPSGPLNLIETTVMKKSLQGNEAAYQAASPQMRISDDAPPFMVIHGDKDSLVPIEEGRLFADKLSNISKQPVVYAEISGAQHAFDMFPSVRSEHVKHGVEKFLTYLHSQYLNQKTGAE